MPTPKDSEKAAEQLLHSARRRKEAEEQKKKDKKLDEILLQIVPIILLVSGTLMIGYGALGVNEISQKERLLRGLCIGLGIVVDITSLRSLALRMYDSRNKRD